MTTYRPTTAFIVPPIYQGQHIEYAYAIDAETEVILERRTDDTHAVRYFAYAYPQHDTDDWQPQNAVPSRGRSLGECKVRP